MTVDYRRPAVKTKIQPSDSTRPPLEFNSFEKTKGADGLGLPLWFRIFIFFEEK
jgi:hypothetical protein